MCIRVSARTTLVLVAFSTENFVLPFCRTQIPESITAICHEGVLTGQHLPE